MMAAGAGAIRAGQAFVELFTDNSKLLRGLQQGKATLLSWAASVGRIGLGEIGLGGAALAPLAKLLADAAGRGNALKGLADNIGEGAGGLSLLANGFERAGGSLDGFAAAMEGLKLKISQAADANDFLLDSLRSLGRGRELLDVGLDEQLDRIAERIKAIPRGADQLRVAGDLGLSQLLPWLRKGKDGLDELRKAAKDAGEELTPEQAEQSRAIVQGYRDTMLSLKGAIREVGFALLPTGEQLAGLAGQFREGVAQARNWLKENAGLVRAAALGAAGLVGLGAALIALKVILVGGAAALGAVSLAVTGIGAGLSFLLSPIGLVTAGLAGLAAAWVTQTESGQQFATSFGDLLRSVGETFKETWGGIVAALGKGDLQKAGEVAFKGLEVAWRKLLLELTKLWGEFKAMIADTFRDAASGASLMSNDVRAWLARRAVGLGLGGGLTEEDIRRHQQGVNDQILNRNLADQQKANAARAAALKRAEEELKKAEAEFKAVVEEAKQPAAGPGRFAELVGVAGGVMRGALAKMAAMPSPRAPGLVAADAVRGVFSGPFNQQLGLGDTLARRQLDAAEGIRNNTAVLPDMAKGLNALGQQLRFK